MTKGTHIQRLLEIMSRLRAPSGCPWDVEQNHQTLKPYLLEETYEVLEAIDQGKDDALCEELGDLLLQVVFHAQIAAEAGRFDFEKISQSIADKLVRRHPHVFGDTVVDNAGEVVTNWDEIKKQEKRERGAVSSSVLDDIGNNLPALFESLKLSKKAAKLGFDWPDVRGVVAKINEEMGELSEAASAANPAQIEEECGDLLFAVVNLCRKLQVNPELALHSANRKFRKRFAWMENSVAPQSTSLHDLKPAEWDDLWNQSKKNV